MAPKVRISSRPVFFHLRLAAPFSPRIRARAEMRHESELLNSVIKHVLVSTDKRLALVKNSKAGSTTAAQVLYTLQHGRAFDGRIHDRESRQIQGGNHIAEVLSALRDPASFKFSFVRHPTRRIVSGFLDFVVEGGNPTAFRHAQFFRSFGIVAGDTSASNFNRFLDYVEEGLRVNALYSDRHFRTQVLNLALPEVDYGMIGKLENFAADMEEVLRRAGVWHEDLRPFLATRANSTRPVRFEPDAVAVRRIGKIYADDFDRFGYAPTSG